MTTTQKSNGAPSNWKAIIRAAIKEYGHNKLAKMVGVSSQRLAWIATKQRTPPTGELAIQFDKGTDGKINRADLRPDLFGKS